MGAIINFPIKKTDSEDHIKHLVELFSKNIIENILKDKSIKTYTWKFSRI